MFKAMANSKNEDENFIRLPFLVKIYGENVNKKYMLNGLLMNVGRHPRSHIKIDSINVSRNHCTLRFYNGAWTLKDNDSQNGTYVNGQRLKKNQLVALQIGDIIFLGPPSESPQAFSFDDYLDEREHIFLDSQEKECTKENNTQPSTEPNPLIQSSVEAKNAEVKNNQEDLNKKNILASSSNKNSIKPSDASEQMDTSDKKDLQKKTKNQGKSKLENKECVPSTSQKLCSRAKPQEDEVNQIENDSESLLDAESDIMCDQELYSCTQKPDDNATEENAVSKKVEGGTSQTKRRSDENDSELLKTKLALLSEEVKQLEKSKSDLLKEYESVRNKNKMLDDALAEQRRLKEEMQMCEQRVKNNFKTQIMEKLEEELICNICTEVLIKPTVLDCTHTFCEHCISEWKKKKRQCPICRNKIKTQTRILALDDFIGKTIETLTPGQKERRKEVILQREKLKNKPRTPVSRRKRGRGRSRRTPGRNQRYRAPSPILAEIYDAVRPIPSPIIQTGNIATSTAATYAWVPDIFMSDSDNDSAVDMDIIAEP